MANVPDLVPATLGVEVTLTAQLPPAGMLPPQVWGLPEVATSHRAGDLQRIVPGVADSHRLFAANSREPTTTGFLFRVICLAAGLSIHRPCECSPVQASSGIKD
jgi:hypothetical protein